MKLLEKSSSFQGSYSDTGEMVWWAGFPGSICIYLYVLLKKMLKSYKDVCADDENDKI